MSYEYEIMVKNDTSINEVVLQKILSLLQERLPLENFKKENKSIVMENRDIHSKWKFLVSIDNYTDKLLISMDVDRNQRTIILESIEHVLSIYNITYDWSS